MQNSTLKSDPEISRGAQKNCQDCLKKFSIILRQHQCKRCLKAVCSQCGNFRRQVYSPNFTMRDHRVCRSCKELSDYITNYVKSEELKFGEMSDTGKKWMKKIIIKPSTSGTTTAQHSLLSKEYFEGLWGTYSFELRELVGILTFKKQQAEFYDNIKAVLKTVISASPQFQASQIIHLIVFVLCFCSADKAPFIVLSLLQLRHTEKDLKQLAYKYLKALPFKSDLSNKLQAFINYRLNRFIDSFLVNCLTIDLGIHIINKVLEKRSLEELLIVFATHIYLNREMVLAKNSQDKLYLDILMLRKCIQQSQINANSRYFKVKNLVAIYNDPNNENSELRKTYTMNIDRDYSPNSDQFQSEDLAKLKLVNRPSIEYRNSRDIEDSFSICIQANDNPLKLSPSDPEIKQNKSVLEEFQESLSVRGTQKNQESPFKKTVTEELPEDLPQLLQMIKPVRKSTDPDQIRGALAVCEKCSLYQQKAEGALKLLKIEREKWSQQKQAMQDSHENLSEHAQRLTTDNFSKKTKISELQALNNQSLTQMKQTLQKMKTLQESNLKTEFALEKLKEEKKILNQKVISETNDNIKLHAALEQEKRNVKEAREMCLQSNKNVQALKQKINELQKALTESAKKQTELKNLAAQNEATINSLQGTVAELSQREKLSIKQRSQNSSELQNANLELTSKVAEVTRVAQERNKKIFELTTKIQELTIALQQKSKEASEFTGKIAQRNSVIESSNKQISEQTNKIFDLNAEIVQNGKEAARQHAEYQSKEEEVRRLNAKLQQLMSINTQALSADQKNKEEKSILNAKIRQQQISLSKLKQCQATHEQFKLEVITRQKKQTQQMNVLLLKLKEKGEVILQMEEQVRSLKELNQQSKNEINSSANKLASCSQELTDIREQKEFIQMQAKKALLMFQDEKLFAKTKINQASISFEDTINAEKSQINLLKEANQTQQKLIQELKETLESAKSENQFLIQRTASLQAELSQAGQSVQVMNVKLLKLRREMQEEAQISHSQNKEIIQLREEMSVLYSQRSKVSIEQLQGELSKYETKNKELLDKLSDISELMMQIEEEKMELADELFNIHQFIKAKGISFRKSI